MAYKKLVDDESTTKQPRKADDGYLTQDIGGFVYLSKKKRPDPGDKPKENEGWKIHISLDCPNDNEFYNDTILKAWKILEPILIKYRVFLSKVRKPVKVRKSPEEGGPQLGKEITIYHFNSREDLSWADLLQEIEYALFLNKIRPGKNPLYRVGEIFTDIAEPEIKGSLYLFAECDKFKNVTEIDPKNLGPFVDISVSASVASRGGAGAAMAPLVATTGGASAYASGKSMGADTHVAAKALTDRTDLPLALAPAVFFATLHREATPAAAGGAGAAATPAVVNPVGSAYDGPDLLEFPARESIAARAAAAATTSGEGRGATNTEKVPAFKP